MHEPHSRSDRGHRQPGRPATSGNRPGGPSPGPYDRPVPAVDDAIADCVDRFATELTLALAATPLGRSSTDELRRAFAKEALQLAAAVIDADAAHDDVELLAYIEAVRRVYPSLAPDLVSAAEIRTSAWSRVRRSSSSPCRRCSASSSSTTRRGHHARPSLLRRRDRRGLRDRVRRRARIADRAPCRRALPQRPARRDGRPTAPEPDRDTGRRHGGRRARSPGHHRRPTRRRVPSTSSSPSSTP